VLKQFAKKYTVAKTWGKDQGAKVAKGGGLGEEEEAAEAARGGPRARRKRKEKWAAGVEGAAEGVGEGVAGGGEEGWTQISMGGVANSRYGILTECHHHHTHISCSIPRANAGGAFGW
jgi:hypothetical protein